MAFAELLASPSVGQAVVLVLATTVVVQSVRWLLWYRSHFKFFNSLPGETEFSFIWGNLQKIRLGRGDHFIKYSNSLMLKNPKFHRFWVGPLQAQISLNHPDTVKGLLKTAGPKPWTYDKIKCWLGEGLLIAMGERWNRSRRLLTPAFHFDILKPYNTISNRACDLFLAKIEKHASEKKSLEMFSLISLCTLDVILQCAMGFKDDIQTKGESHPYVQAVLNLSDLFVERIRNPLYHSDWIYGLTANGKKTKEMCDYAHSVADRIIAARKESLERDGPPKKRHLDFLDILLTAKDGSGKGLTPLEIREEVDTFLFEGHDTTASAVAWAMYSLCQNPDCQTKVQQELDRVLQGRDSDDIEWEDLSKLEYLTMVVKESMRLNSPVPLVSRRLIEPLTVEGITLPPGSLCTINILNVHHNPTVWPQPEEFRPERFHPDNVKDRDSYAFIPFSAGPRNCIGQHFALNEQKVLLARLLRRFTFTLDPDHTAEKEIKVVMRSVDGIWMKAEPRIPTQ